MKTRVINKEYFSDHFSITISRDWCEIYYLKHSLDRNRRFNMLVPKDALDDLGELIDYIKTEREKDE